MMVEQGVPAAFLQALVATDFDALRDLFADDVWVRAMLVREIVELHDADAARSLFEEWYGTPHEVEFTDTDQHTIMGRRFIRYRARLRPVWAPDVWHVVEQAGYLTVKECRIQRIDLTCTGFFPLDRHPERRPAGHAPVP